jgi:CheY-like chemotaxis protein
MDRANEKKILVVDDEPDVRNFLMTCIQDAGFIVDSAVDGQDALDKIEKERPDLMTLDMNMPKVSGIKLIRILRRKKELSRLPIIVVTAHAHNEFASEDVKTFNAFTSGLKPKRTIEKPVTPEVLIKTICEILDVEPVTDIAIDKPISSDEANLAKMLKNSDPETLQKIKDLLAGG